MKIGCDPFGSGVLNLRTVRCYGTIYCATFTCIHELHTPAKILVTDLAVRAKVLLLVVNGNVFHLNLACTGMQPCTSRKHRTLEINMASPACQ